MYPADKIPKSKLFGGNLAPDEKITGDVFVECLHGWEERSQRREEGLHAEDDEGLL